MVMAPPATHEAAVSPCFHSCPAFLHRHFSPPSPPSFSFNLSLHSQQQPSPWDFSTIPKLQLSATVPSRALCSCPGYVWLLQGLLDSHSILAATDQLFHSVLNVSPLTNIIVPMWGSDPCFSTPLSQGRSRPTNTPVFLPSSFTLPSFAWFYIFFSTGQVLSLCSACTSVSESAFLMHPLREMFFMTTCSPVILSSSVVFLYINLLSERIY